MDGRYKCPKCEWIGTEDEMEADYTDYLPPSEECWSNWICPSCKTWHQLDDYEKLASDAGAEDK